MILLLIKPYHIEKCSESTGMKFVLFLINSFLIKFQPYNCFFIGCNYFSKLIISIVGFNPSKPEIELIV